MKRVFTVLSFLFIATMIFGQYDPKENFYDGEFFFAEEDYSEALYAFTQVYKEGYQENSNINYRIGICLLNIDGRETEAIPYLETAVKNITERYSEGSFKETAAPPDAWLYLGNALRINHDFQKAINAYNTYLNFTDPDSELAVYTKLQIEACNKADEVMRNSATYKVASLGQINAIRAPVYNAVISGDMNTLSFMGRQKFYNGVYICRNVDGKWTKPYNITPSIVSDGNQNTLALSHDGNQLLLAWYDNFESDIWISEYRNNRWYPSEPIGKPVNSKYYESHACFTPDGNTIYFTSNRKESLGEMDIFRTTKLSDGSWGDLETLGPNVNTVLNEENPFVSPDGKRLYFSSQGHSGLGGFDIYYCEINADGSLGKPINIGYPLNSADDDFAFSPKDISLDTQLAIYAKDGNSEVDIYSFEWIPEGTQPIAQAMEIKTVTVDPVIVPEEVAQVTEEPVEEVVEEIAEPVEEVVEAVEEVVEEVKEEVVPPEKPVETYLIKPIFFDFDSYALTSQAKQKLDGLSAILKKFPSVHLEITGHTDAIGTDSYNVMLSQKRAKSVADYLIDSGIEKDRLNIMAKGEREPVAINRTSDNHDSPKGRALNRRVHFKVTVPGGVLIEIDGVKVPEELMLR